MYTQGFWELGKALGVEENGTGVRDDLRENVPTEWDRSRMQL